MIFGHNFVHTILVASTERPAMSTSTPVLDSRPRNPLGGIKRRSKGTTLTTRTRLWHRRTTNPKQRLLLLPSVLLARLKKAVSRTHRFENEPRRGLPLPLEPHRKQPLNLDPRRKLRPPTHSLSQPAAK